MLKYIFTMGLLAAASLSVSTPAESASTTNSQNVEMKLMMDASAKMLDVVTAQLDGDTAKLEKAAAETNAIYDQILSANPNNVKALNGRATVKNTVRPGDGDADLAKAIDITSAAIKLNDKDATAYHDRAVSYRGLKKFDEARVDYKKAIELNPSMVHWETELRAMETEVR